MYPINCSAIISQLIDIISRKEQRSSIAILYRTHFQSRVIEEALIKQSIPYKIIGGIQNDLDRFSRSTKTEVHISKNDNNKICLIFNDLDA